MIVLYDWSGRKKDQGETIFNSENRFNSNQNKIKK